MKFLGVIPARYDSTRFPGKPLAKIAGKEMILYVVEQAGQSKLSGDVIVATDDDRILRCVRGAGYRAMMTSRRHASGTDRLVEVSRKIFADVYINIQGDEPLISPRAINALMNPFSTRRDVLIATLKKQFADTEAGFAEVHSSNIVKVITNKQGQALYFSRSVIPYDRDRTQTIKYYKHLGIYAFRRKILQKFSSLKSSLEKIEKLEQLRFIENGIPIDVIETKYESIGVDTPEDIDKIEKLLKNK